jgi:hypothetical protein
MLPERGPLAAQKGLFSVSRLQNYTILPTYAGFVELNNVDFQQITPFCKQKAPALL